MRSLTSTRSRNRLSPLAPPATVLGVVGHPVVLTVVLTVVLSVAILSVVTPGEPPRRAALSVAACFAAAATALYGEVFSLPARLRRVTGQLGLGTRMPSGRVRRLRCCSWRQVTRHHALLTWRLPPGVTLSDVLREQEAIEHAMDSEIVCWVERRRLVMEVFRAPICRRRLSVAT